MNTESITHASETTYVLGTTENFRMRDIPESLSLLQEAQEQLGQDQEQELLKQLKEQHQSVTKTAIRQSHVQLRKSC